MWEKEDILSLLSFMFVKYKGKKYLVLPLSTMSNKGKKLQNFPLMRYFYLPAIKCSSVHLLTSHYGCWYCLQPLFHSSSCGYLGLPPRSCRECIKNSGILLKPLHSTMIFKLLNKFQICSQLLPFNIF